MDFLLYLIIAVVAIGAIYYFFFKNRPKEHAQLVKQAGIDYTNPNYEELNSGEKKLILTHIIHFNQFGLDASLDEMIDAYKAEYDIDKIFEALFRVSKANHEMLFIEALQILKADGNLDVFSKAFIDQKNAMVDIPLKYHLMHLKNDQDPKTLVEASITALRAGVELDLKELIKNKLDDDAIKTISHALIRAKKAHIFQTEAERLSLNLALPKDFQLSFRVTQKFLLELFLAKRDVNSFVNTLIRAHEAELDLNLSLLDIFSINDKDFDALINNLIKAQKVGIFIDQDDLIHQNISGNDINNLVMAIIMAKKIGLEIEFHELMEYHVHTGGDVFKFVKALNISQKDDLGYSKEDLIEMTKPHTDLVDLVTSINTIILKPELQITRSQVESHFMAKGKVMPVLNAIIKARFKNLNMDFSLATSIDLNSEIDLAKAIKWAIEPQIKEVLPRLTIITQEGIQVAPKINVTLRGKIEKIFSGYREEILFARINESVVAEIEAYENHEDVLENLPQISKRIMRKLNGKWFTDEAKTKVEAEELIQRNKKEIELNEYSAYQILEINIFDLEIGKNITAQLEKEQAEIDAHIHELHAHAELAKAEADLRKAMVESYRSGEIPNFNELHKDNLMKDEERDHHDYNKENQNKKDEKH